MNATSRLGLATVLGLAAAIAQAGSIGVGPTRMELDARAPVQTLTVQNTSDSPTVVQVDVHRWQQTYTTDELVPAPELAATPRVFELKPGQSRVVRVGLRDPKPVAVEGAYRLYVKEVQTTSGAQGAQLRYLMKVGVPVFVNPSSSPGKPMISWTLEPLARGCHQLKLVNSGTRRERILAVDYLENTHTAWRSDIPQYLLAGAQRLLTGSPCINYTPGAGELFVQTEQGRHRVPWVPFKK